MRNYYCVYDKKIGSYMPLFEQEDDNGCLVNIRREIASGNGTLAKFPQDFKLFRVAQQDEKTGELKVELFEIADLAQEVQHA